MKENRLKIKRVFSKLFVGGTWILFIIYSCLLFKLLVLKHWTISSAISAMSYYFSSGNFKNYLKYNFNIIPFETITQYLFRAPHINYAVYNIGGNILAFMPLGFLLPILFKKIRSFKSIILSSLGVSFLIETIQIVTWLGSFDIDDLILNVLGGLIGFLIFYIMHRVLMRWNIVRNDT